MPVTRLTAHRRIGGALILALALFVTTAPVVLACGRDTDCLIGARSYRIALPDNHDGTSRLGSIVFTHGFRGTAKGVMRNKALTALASELGVAFIAAQADGPEWIIPGIPSSNLRQGVDELAYYDALIDDATSRFAIDRKLIMASGFSSGAMMVWHLACHRGTSFTGFAPMSGTFWEPLPQSCPAGPVNLIHYHGDADPVVPLKGRRIKDAHQGDVSEAINLLARSGGYRPVETTQTQSLQCARQVNSGEKLLEFCLFHGGHQLKAANLARAWRIFAAWKGR